MAWRRGRMLWTEKWLEGVPRGYSLASSRWVRLVDVVAGLLEPVLLRPWYAHVAIDRPIFVVGPFRSGTTVLEKIIAAHPAVGHFWYLTSACSRAPVTGYWEARLLQRFSLLARDAVPAVHNPRLGLTVFSPCECEWVWSRSRRSLWDEACADLKLEADFSAPRFERYFLSLIRRHLWVQGASRFVNKNPVHCLRMAYLRKLFPDARFVAIVRDPLDTIVSHHRAAERFRRVVYGDRTVERIFDEALHVDTLTMRVRTRTFARTRALDRIHPLLGIANQWKDLQGAVLSSVAADPGLAGQALLLRYEELVSRPVPVLRRMWGFIDLDDEEAKDITETYAPRLTPPSPPDLDREEGEVLLRAWEIVAPVAARLGYGE